MSSRRDLGHTDRGTSGPSQVLLIRGPSHPLATIRLRPSAFGGQSAQGHRRNSGTNGGSHRPRMRGPSHPRAVSAVTAHTSASSRSGERPSDKPSGPKSHNSFKTRFASQIQCSAFYNATPKKPVKARIVPAHCKTEIGLIAPPVTTTRARAITTITITPKTQSPAAATTPLRGKTCMEVRDADPKYRACRRHASPPC